MIETKCGPILEEELKKEEAEAKMDEMMEYCHYNEEECDQWVEDYENSYEPIDYGE